MIDKDRCLEYRGFYGSVAYSAPDDLLYGKILDIHGLFMYDGTSLDELKKEFADTVERWLDFCEAEREEEMQSHAPVREMAIA
ncbi:MAG: hypothetical protein LBE35_00320 [Clostridiales bacterium]|jgi:predicted HicB family RNase H-like nuclease|nr:hypothetical protein [Clostridiales bacterium]